MCLDLTAHAVLWIGLQNHQQGAGRRKICSVRFVVRNTKCCDAVERYNAGSNPLRTPCAADCAWGPRRRCSAVKLTKVKQRVQILQRNGYRLNDTLRLDAAHSMPPLRLNSFLLNVTVNDTLPFFWRGTISSLPPLLLQCHFLMHSHAARRSAAALFLLIHHPVWPAMFISANRFWFFSRYFRQSLHQHTICPLSSLCKC